MFSACDNGKWYCHEDICDAAADITAFEVVTFDGFRFFIDDLRRYTLVDYQDNNEGFQLYSQAYLVSSIPNVISIISILECCITKFLDIGYMC